MLEITDPAAVRAVLNDPAFVPPPVPPASTGIGWLRATVGRFAGGAVHARRRALQVAVLDGIPPAVLRDGPPAHPVATLARAMGASDVPVDQVREVARAYQPGTGDDTRADVAVEALVRVFGGVHDEATAARIGILVQACDATAALIERARERTVGDVLRDDPPVPATKRQAGPGAALDIEAGTVVRVRLAGDLAFGAGPRRCPGREHALALVDAAAPRAT